MARLRRLYEPGMTYLITAVIHRREKVLADAVCAQAAHEDVAFYARKFGLVSLAHVVMPDHMHWVMYPAPEDFERFAREERACGGKYAEAPERFYLSKILEDYKRHVSFVVNDLRRTRGAQVWQEGFRDDGLRTPEAIRATVGYVIRNPVKAGLAEKPEDYPFVGWNVEWLAGLP